MTLKRHQARLDADTANNELTPINTADTLRLRNLMAIPVEQIEADAQHRETFDQAELQSLADSLKSDGQLQPIRVRYDVLRQKYVIVAGERRWRAAKLAVLPTVDCLVLDSTALSDSDILREQILENSLRSDLLPTERARAFRDFISCESITATELASRLHLDPSVIHRSLTLLELPVDIQAKVDAGQLAIKTAIAQHKPNVAKRKSNKPTRQQKIRLANLNMTVTISARKYLKPDDIESALREALAQLDRAA